MNKNSLLGSILGKSGAYGFSGLLAQLVGFVMLPIYTNYMSPQDYGVASLVIFMVSLAEIVFGARLGQAIPKYLNDKNYSFTLPQLYVTAVIASALLSCIALIGVVIWSSGISSLMFETGSYGLAVVIGGFMIVFNGLEQYGLLFLRLQDRPALYVRLAVLKLLLQLGLNVLLIVGYQYGVVGLLLSNLIASVLLTCILQYIACRTVNVRSAMDKSALKVMLKFCTPLWYTSLVSLYVGSVHMIFISRFINLEILGLYALAQRFSGLVLVLFWTPFFQYWQTERFRILNEHDGVRVFSQIFYFVVAGLLFTSLFIIIGAEPVIALLANESFHGAVQYVPLLVVANVFTCMAMYMNFSYMVKEKTYYIFNLKLVAAPLLTAGLFGFTWLLGDTGPALAIATTEVLGYVISAIYAKKIFDLGINQYKTIGLILIFALFVLVAYLAINQFVSMYVRLALISILAACMVSSVYILMKKGCIFTFLLKEKTGE